MTIRFTVFFSRGFLFQWMFDHYYCINSIKTQQKLRKCLRTLFFSHIIYLHWLLTRTFLQICSTGAVVRFSWSVVLIWRLGTCFAWRPKTGVNKVAKPCINSRWIALLINGFLSVKTWLLITCGTSNYAIIYIHQFSIYIHQFSIYIHQFSIYIHQFSIYIHQFSIYIHQFSTTFINFQSTFINFQLHSSIFNLHSSIFNLHSSIFNLHSSIFNYIHQFSIYIHQFSTTFINFESTFINFCRKKTHGIRFKISQQKHSITWYHEPKRDKTNKITCAPNEDSDQCGNPPRLISLRCALFG